MVKLLMVIARARRNEAIQTLTLIAQVWIASLSLAMTVEQFDQQSSGSSGRPT
jgi:hypothetical protein